MPGGRFDSVLMSRLGAIALVVALAPAAARGQAPAGGPAAPPDAPSSGPLLPGTSVPPGPVPFTPPPTDTSRPVSATPQVVEVRIEGNKAIETHKIMPHIKTRADRPLDKSTVEDDVKRLTKTHQFINVEPRYERRPDGGIIIIYHVVERPLIRYVRIYGSSRSERTLAKKAGLKVGDALDPYAVEEARTKLEEYLRSKAYAQATVIIVEGTKPGDKGVKMMVNEGLKQKIWAVEFEGNTVAPDKRMGTQIQSKPPILWFFKGEVDYTRIDEDVRRLTDYYRGLGFFRARVGREWIFNEKQNWMTLKFVIDEGPRYVVNNVSVIGNSRLQADALTKNLKLKGGDFFDQSKLNKDITGVQDKYGEVGYIFADIQPETRFLEQPAQLDLVYKIEEGDRYRVGRIDVKIGGDNPHTRRTAVLNRLSLRTGDIANTKKLRDSERRLKASQMLANTPAQGQVPKIVFAKPGMEDEEEDENETSVARRQGRKKGPGVQAPMGFGGQGMGNSMGGGGGGMGGMGGGGMNGMGFNGQSPDPEDEEEDDEEDTTPDNFDDDGEGELREGESAEVELIPEGLAPPPNHLTKTTVARPWITGDTRQFVVRGQSPNDAGSSFGQQPLGRVSPDAPTGYAALRPGRASRGRSSCNHCRAGDTGRPPGRPLLLRRNFRSRLFRRRRLLHIRRRAPMPRRAVTPLRINTVHSRPPVMARRRHQATDKRRPMARRRPMRSLPPMRNPMGAMRRRQLRRPMVRPCCLRLRPCRAVRSRPPYVPPLLNNAPAGAVASPGGYAGPGDIYPPGVGPIEEDPPRDIPIKIMGNETQTGRLMLGVGVNSNAGLIGNITLDEQNFDWRRWPTSWEDIRNATAWRGGGQQFRIQASPGTVYQQYSINFHNPYLFDTPISFGLGGSYFTRIYNNWEEQRLGARVSLGYQFLFDPNLSTAVSFRAENVNISNPTVPTPPELEQVLGNNALYIGKWEIIHDTPRQLVPGHPRAPHRHRPRAGLRQLCLPACHDQRVATFPAARAAGHVGSANLEL